MQHSGKYGPISVYILSKQSCYFVPRVVGEKGVSGVQNLFYQLPLSLQKRPFSFLLVCLKIPHPFLVLSNKYNWWTITKLKYYPYLQCFTTSPCGHVILLGIWSFHTNILLTVRCLTSITSSTAYVTDDPQTQGEDLYNSEHRGTNPQSYSSSKIRIKLGILAKRHKSSNMKYLTLKVLNFWKFTWKGGGRISGT